MRAAGFDPLGALRVLEKLGGIDAGAESGRAGRVPLHAPRPSTPRIRELRERLALEGSGAGA